RRNATRLMQVHVHRAWLLAWFASSLRVVMKGVESVLQGESNPRPVPLSPISSPPFSCRVFNSGMHLVVKGELWLVLLLPYWLFFCCNRRRLDQVRGRGFTS